MLGVANLSWSRTVGEEEWWSSLGRPGSGVSIVARYSVSRREHQLPPSTSDPLEIPRILSTSGCSDRQIASLILFEEVFLGDGCAGGHGAATFKDLFCPKQLISIPAPSWI